MFSSKNSDVFVFRNGEQQQRRMLNDKTVRSLPFGGRGLWVSVPNILLCRELFNAKKVFLMKKNENSCLRRQLNERFFVFLSRTTKSLSYILSPFDAFFRDIKYKVAYAVPNEVKSFLMKLHEAVIGWENVVQDIMKAFT